MADLKLLLFGAPRLERDGQPLALRRSKALALLAYLVITRRPHTRETLLGLLWPEFDAASARNNLRRELSLLRSLLGDQAVLTHGQQVEWNPAAAVWCDATLFQERLDLAAQLPLMSPQRAEALAEAVALAGEPFLAGLTLPECPGFEEWQFLQGEVLSRQLATALCALVAWHIEQGTAHEGIGYARRWVTLDPLHEPAQRALIRCYALAGQYSAALRQYETCVRLLDAELGTAPEQATIDLAEAIRKRRLAPSAPDATPLADQAAAPDMPAATPEPTAAETPPAYQDLPQPATPLLGRATELATLRGYLERPHARLITLVGPGGVGKSRLAIELAAHVGPSVADGVAFVALQSVTVPDLLVAAIADAVGCRLSGSAAPRVQLCSHLRERSLLLLLDNFEHLLAGAELLSELLAAAPKLRLLITSREVLNLEEEWSYPLNGLPVPAERESLHSSDQYAAVALFVERAQRARPSFALVDEQVGVARICRLVDGLPLAIELAAAWTAALDCRQIVAEIERNLAFLVARQRNVSERHRSMRAVFDSSWELLNLDERTAFSRLAIFRGGFTADAALHVAGASPTTIATLVDKSLLRLEAGGRYQIHELLRQYAEEQLAGQPAAVQQVRQAHSDYYLAFLAERDEAVTYGRDVVRTAEIRVELMNVRLAWQHAAERGTLEAAGRAINTLANFYLYCGPYEEGIALFEQSVQILRAAPPSERRDMMLAEALHEQAWLLLNAGQVEAARAGLEATQQIYARRGVLPPNTGRVSSPLAGLAALALFEGDYVEAARLTDEYLRFNAAEEYAAQRPIGWILLSRIAFAQGLYTRARYAAEQAYLGVRAANDRWLEAFVLIDLGKADLAQRQFAAARRHFQAAYAIRAAFDDPEGKALALAHEGTVALRQGEPAAAHELFARSLAIYSTRGDRQGLAEASLGQALACLALNAEVEAAGHFRTALELGRVTQLVPLILSTLVGVSELLQRRGRTHEAYDLLILVLRHPATDRETGEQAQLLLLSYEQQRSATEPDAVAMPTAALLDAVVGRLLVELAELAPPRPFDAAAGPAS